ncbi:MAG: hypothetical protein ABSG93_17570 [Solirubrobacteraceae bacterium]
MLKEFQHFVDYPVIVLQRYQNLNRAPEPHRGGPDGKSARRLIRQPAITSRENLMETRVLRVPEQVHTQATQIAALRQSQPGHLVAAAWREYIENHRDEFAADLETTAKLLRDGTLEQLAEFTSRNADARAAEAVERLNSKRAQSTDGEPADETESTRT